MGLIIKDNFVKEFIDEGEEVVCIPDGIEYIENWAFKETNVVCVVIPESVWLIGDEAFLNCSKLKEVVLPKSLKVIGDSAFWGCESLIFLNLPEGVTNIKRCAFYSCASLRKITLPSTLETLDNYAFENCSALEKVEICEGITKIGNEAFANCPALSQINLPKSLKKIGTNLFLNSPNVPNEAKERFSEIEEYEKYELINPDLVAKDGIEVHAVTKGEGHKTVGGISLVKLKLSHEEYCKIFNQIKGYKAIITSYSKSEGYGDKTSSKEIRLKAEWIVVDGENFFGLLMTREDSFHSYNDSRTSFVNVLVKPDGKRVQILSKETWSEGNGDSSREEYVTLEKTEK